PHLSQESRERRSPFGATPGSALDPDGEKAYARSCARLVAPNPRLLGYIAGEDDLALVAFKLGP
ncbi:MAG: hypothetical protein LC799_26220, partial [Actinobacteria bacterium]|nr:hypothetical protein [Actinomycetota bacterium]